jgi:hypothetical protein
VVGNMVYVWSGLTEAIGLRYYGVPGIHLEPNVGFQYREPAERDAFMRPDEYDALIADPTGFLLNVWLPRVSRDVVPPGAPATARSHLSFLKGGMALLQYFSAFGTQAARLRSEAGTVSAISGILKAPFDILGDKLRGYMGLTRDMRTQPEKVRRACEALQPHLLHVALGGADPAGQVPIGFWMHRGCVPFVTPAQFESHYWPTLAPIITELWRRGHQTLFYAEGDWSRHLERFAALPDQSIVYHVDRGDLASTHRTLGCKFCLSGGLPNTLLSYGTPDDVRTACRHIIATVARDGGYILDASAIIQNDARTENLRVLTDYAREHGVYSRGHATPRSPAPAPEPPSAPPSTPQRSPQRPGVCIPWSEQRALLPPLTGDETLVQRVWEDIDSLAHTYIWHCLVSF